MIHMIMYLIHILQYMLRNVFVLKYFGSLPVCACACLCVFVFVCVCVCVVSMFMWFMRTQMCNDMRMTGITRRRGFMRTFSVSP